MISDHPAATSGGANGGRNVCYLGLTLKMLFGTDPEEPLKTGAGNQWIAKRLAMGHSGSVSRLVTAAAKHPPTVRELEKLCEMLKCDT